MGESLEDHPLAGDTRGVAQAPSTDTARAPNRGGARRERQSLNASANENLGSKRRPPEQVGEQNFKMKAPAGPSLRLFSRFIIDQLVKIE